MHSSKSPETSQKSISEYIKNTERKKFTRGATPCPRGWGRALPPGRAPLPRGPPGRPPVTIFCYMKSFTLEKIISKLAGRNTTATRRNLGGTNLGLRRSCSVGGTSPPGRGNHRHRHHHRSSHLEWANLHQHLHQHHLLSNPSSSLVSNLFIQTSDWYL